MGTSSGHVQVGLLSAMISPDSPIFFATLSMLFAGINDVVFKRYSAKDRSRGMYVLGIGVVWTVLQVGTFWLKGTPFTLGDCKHGSPQHREKPLSLLLSVFRMGRRREAFFDLVLVVKMFS